MRWLLFGVNKMLTLWCSLRWLHVCHLFAILCFCFFSNYINLSPFAIPFWLFFLMIKSTENFNSLQGKLSQLILWNECKLVLGTPVFSKTVRAYSHTFPGSSKINNVIFGEVCITQVGLRHLQCKAYRCGRWTTVNWCSLPSAAVGLEVLAGITDAACALSTKTSLSAQVLLSLETWSLKKHFQKRFINNSSLKKSAGT